MKKLGVSSVASRETRLREYLLRRRRKRIGFAFNHVAVRSESEREDQLGNQHKRWQMISIRHKNSTSFYSRDTNDVELNPPQTNPTDSHPLFIFVPTTSSPIQTPSPTTQSQSLPPIPTNVLDTKSPHAAFPAPRLPPHHPLSHRLASRTENVQNGLAAFVHSAYLVRSGAQ